MKKIVFELSPDSIDRANEELKAYKKDLKKKLKEVCKRLAEIGAQEASKRFAVGAREYNSDVHVGTRPIENGYAITASGSDVYFVEFGTGINATSTHGFNVSVPVYPGSFSEQNSQKYSTYGFWWYRKTKYDGTPAYMPMYYAEKAIRENYKRVVLEVLGL